MNEFVWEFTTDKVRRLIMKGIRLDKRGMMDYRNVYIEKGVIYNADGSAFVNLGGTKVIAGVKFELGEPFPDKPDEGTLMVDAEILPLSSPSVEPGPPDEEAIELARIVDRSIRESRAVDFKGLCIREGELVYRLFVDIRVLDYNGNMIDASSLAAAAALLNTRVPRVEDDTIQPHEYEKVLELREVPLYTTFVKVGKAIAVDPNLAEEKAADARISIATVDDESITAMQKGGSGAFTAREIETLVEESIKKGKELRKKVRG